MSRRIKRERITIVLDLGPRDVEAEIYGIWAVTQETPDHGYTVTHVPTGRRVQPHIFKYPIIPRRIARELADRFPDVMANHDIWWDLDLTEDDQAAAKGILAVFAGHIFGTGAEHHPAYGPPWLPLGDVVERDEATP